MNDADDFDFLAVIKRSFQLWLRAPHVHLLMGALMPLLAIASLGVLLGPLSVGYFRYLRQESSDSKPPFKLLFSGFSGQFWLASRTGLVLMWGTIAGLALGIVPGLVFLAIFGFAVRSVADGARTLPEAMRASLEVAKARAGIVSRLYGFAFLLQLIGHTTFVLAPVTNGLTALVLSEGRERMFV